jgi:hypothetical protein
MQNGESMCYGFVNFSTHEDALRGLAAVEQGLILVKGNRKKIWQVKAEWSRRNSCRRLRVGICKNFFQHVAPAPSANVDQRDGKVTEPYTTSSKGSNPLLGTLGVSIDDFFRAQATPYED